MQVVERRGRTYRGAGVVDWPVRSPAEVGVDPAALEEAAAFAEAHGADSLIILHGGALVFERYWNGRGPSSLQQTFSGTKSLFSLLILRLIRRGSVQGLDQAVRELVPELSDPRGQLTFRSVMAMQSGMETSAEIEALGETGLTQLEIALTRDITAAPFSLYHYNNAAYRLLFTALERATGRSLETLTEEELFQPLGFGEAYWRLLWWSQGEQERFQGYQSICMRPLDFAKSAQIIIDDGLWRGAPFVDADLCRALVTAPYPGDNPSFGLFHHLNAGAWFRNMVQPLRLDRKLAPGSPDDLFLQCGVGGQIVAGCRSLQLVVARTGATAGQSIYSRDNHFAQLLAMIARLF